MNEVANVAFLGRAAYSVISSLMVPLVPLCLATRVQDAHPVLRDVGTVLGIILSIGFGIGLWRQWRLTCKHSASMAALCRRLSNKAHQAAADAGRPLAHASRTFTLVVPSLGANALACMGG